MTGWMDCAIKTSGKDFMAGIIVDHNDGTVKFYINKSSRFPAAEDALSFARRSRPESTFKGWTHCYAITGVNSISETSDE